MIFKYSLLLLKYDPVKSIISFLYMIAMFVFIFLVVGNSTCDLYNRQMFFHNSNYTYMESFNPDEHQFEKNNEFINIDDSISNGKTPKSCSIFMCLNDELRKTSFFTDKNMYRISNTKYEGNLIYITTDTAKFLDVKIGSRLYLNRTIGANDLYFTVAGILKSSYPFDGIDRKDTPPVLAVITEKTLKFVKGTCAGNYQITRFESGEPDLTNENSISKETQMKLLFDSWKNSSEMFFSYIALFGILIVFCIVLFLEFDFVIKNNRKTLILFSMLGMTLSKIKRILSCVFLIPVFISIFISFIITIPIFTYIQNLTVSFEYSILLIILLMLLSLIISLFKNFFKLRI